MPSASLTSRGQVTVPKVIRELLKVKTGDRLDFVIEGDRIVLHHETRDLRSLRSLLQRPGRKSISLEKIDVAVARFHSRRR
jgi:AbrB family looped-hinge helix DNA binding protein